MKTRKWFAAFLLIALTYCPVNVFGQDQGVVLSPKSSEKTEQQKVDENLLKLHQIFAWISNLKDPELIAGLDDLIKVYSEIQVHYVDTKSSKELMDLAMKGMVGLLDPYSNLFIDDEAKLVVNSFSEQSYTGGVGLSISRFNKEFYVTEVFEGHPAAKAGIEPGDVILRVDGKNVFGMNTVEVTKLVKGPEGTSVSVEIRSRNRQKPKIFTLIRQKINVSSVTYKELDRKTAYIRIRAFTDETVARFSNALSGASNRSGLVIDLRDNGGGSLDAVIKMISNFIGSNKAVVSAKGRDVLGQDEEFPFFTGNTNSTPVKYPSRVVVLVNNFSASASEVMAGNLKHYKIATIIGVRTFGKATVQNYLDLDTPNHSLGPDTRLLMGITTARYYLPDGTDISSVGIEPDMEVEQPENFRIYEYRTKRDIQLQEAIKFLNKN